MEIKRPDRKWYTCEQLAEERWRSWKVDREYIEHLVDAGELTLSYRIKDDYLGNMRFTHKKPKRYSQFEKLEGEYILLEEVERYERSLTGATAPDNGDIGKKIDIDEYVKENRGKISDDEIAYNLFNNGFHNNEIAVAFGHTYRKGSNALASKVGRMRKRHEKSLVS